MIRPNPTPRAISLLAGLGTLLLAACAGGTGGVRTTPATAGTHTVMGRSFFPGGIMLLVDAHLQDGQAYGTLEYSQVQSRGETSLRIFVDVQCVGLHRDGSEAIVTGPIDRYFGDQVTEINEGDWWVVHIREGGAEGDFLSTLLSDRPRSLSICQIGPETSANLRSVEGDVSIH